ncbi:hypothetical protein AAFF_G00280760 [Aldrovandia affinis]|uniref:Uncharacterized protein n=1 Tax=Aldrovandia affinis TaxID=143900 RepID=A0AAD7RCM7_9TELE|nr:hypothetical protein AAFF_G00280760 [Aldrovandia affinis]
MGGVMACKPVLQAGTRYACLLGLTALLLLFEIIVSRLCNSLINMVDCFHTLFIFLHLLPLPITLATTPALPFSASCARPPPPVGAATTLLGAYGWARVQPLGAMISALLLASLCASVSLDILSHALQPHPIQRPLLAAVAGAASLLFNAAMLGAHWAGLLKLDYGLACSSPAVEECRPSRLEDKAGDVLFSHTEAEFRVQAEESQFAMDTENRYGHISLPNAQGDPQNCPRDRVLLFRNPGASSRPEPELQCHGHTSPSPPPPSPAHVVSHALKPRTRPNVFSQHCSRCGIPASLPHSESVIDSVLQRNSCPGLSHDPAYVAQRDSRTGLNMHPDIQAHRQIRHPDWRSCSFQCRLITLIQSLLGSALVLTNGLALLLSDPDCQHSASCGLFPYLDPGFSFLVVLVLLATALPQARRHGVLLLQATPPGVALDELSRHITAVPGVLALHHLHVWRLTEACLVASVHVRCRPELRASGGVEQVAGVTAVMRGAGVRCSTVQPEFHHAPEGLSDAPAGCSCSLACGTECAGKMCCGSPPAGGSGNV